MSQSSEHNTPSTGQRDPFTDLEAQYRRQARKQAILLPGVLQAIGVVSFVIAALMRFMPEFGTAELVIFLVIGTLAVVAGFLLLLQAFGALSERAVRTGRIVMGGAFGAVILASIINLVF